MTVLTAHRILIGTAIVFFFFFSGYEALRFGESRDPWALVTGLGSLAIGVGFALYWRTIPRE